MANPAIGINSMLIGARPVEEVYELAKNSKSAIPMYIDLRSRRGSNTDPDNIWGIAHTNSDFEISDKTSINRVLQLYKKYKKPLIAVSLYCGACYKQDLNYGLWAIKNASKLADIALDKSLILRFLGGKAKTIEQKQKAIETIGKWLGYSYELCSKTKKKVIIGIEIHQDQWPETLEEALEFRNLLKASTPSNLYNFFGFVDDPANRYIALNDLEIYKSDNENLPELIEDIIYCHLKNVRKLNNSKSIHESFQKVGIKTFGFRQCSFRWADNPGYGDINLENIVLNLMSLSKKSIMGFSTEHIPSTKDPKEAVSTLLYYVSYINDILMTNQNLKVA